MAYHLQVNSLRLTRSQTWAAKSFNRFISTSFAIPVKHIKYTYLYENSSKSKTYSRPTSQILRMGCQPLYRFPHISLIIDLHTTSSLSMCVDEEESMGEETSEKVKKKIDPSLDRSTIIPVETSIKYLNSKAYKTTYGNDPVWLHYRRNFKGYIPPRKTRPTCIKDGHLITGNPCPICRDEYLVIDSKNVILIKQFVSQYNGQILPYSKTGICQEQQIKVEVAVEKAKQSGYLPFYIPFRGYIYEEFFKALRK